MLDVYVSSDSIEACAITTKWCFCKLLISTRCLFTDVYGYAYRVKFCGHGHDWGNPRQRLVT